MEKLGPESMSGSSNYSVTSQHKHCTIPELSHQYYNVNSCYLFEMNGDFFGTVWIAIMDVHGWHFTEFLGTDGAHGLQAGQRNLKHLFLQRKHKSPQG